MFSWNGGNCVCNFWNASNGRSPPPWSIDEANDACFVVRDATGQALG
jgi:hypothetical protein